MKEKRQKILYLFLVLLISDTVIAQTWQWAIKGSGIENDYVNALDVDNQGNSYVTGKFFGSISFGSTTLNNPGAWAVYLAKYDSNGFLLWAKIAASDSAISVSGIGIDNSGAISIVGQYFGTATFGTAIPVSLISTGDYDLFVARYNASGDLLWARSLGGPGIDNAGGVSTDYSGNIFLTGDLHISSFPFSSSKIFIAKYDSIGNNSWFKTEINNGFSHFGNGIKTDSVGNSYITGEFFDTVIFDSLAAIVAGNIEANIFIAKVDSSGNQVWGQKAGAGSGYSGGNAIAIDAFGNSYITGFYHGTISFGSLSITSTSGLGYDVFVARCDYSGNFTWVNKSTGAGSSKSICVDDLGNVYVCGAYAQSITFGTNTLTSAGDYDIFLAKANLSGNFDWSTSCGGLLGDHVECIQINSNCILLAGTFLDTIHFNSSILLVNNSVIKNDVFLAKLNILTGISEEETEGLNYVLFPNPTREKVSISFNLLSGNEAEIIILDVTGREVERINKIKMPAGHGDIEFDASYLCPGLYYAHLKVSGNTYETKKFIKQ